MGTIFFPDFPNASRPAKIRLNDYEDFIPLSILRSLLPGTDPMTSSRDFSWMISYMGG